MYYQNTCFHLQVNGFHINLAVSIPDGNIRQISPEFYPKPLLAVREFIPDILYSIDLWHRCTYFSYNCRTGRAFMQCDTEFCCTWWYRYMKINSLGPTSWDAPLHGASVIMVPRLRRTGSPPILHHIIIREWIRAHVAYRQWTKTSAIATGTVPSYRKVCKHNNPNVNSIRDFYLSAYLRLCRL